jgi:preprotein translocase subunit SecA
MLEPNGRDRDLAGRIKRAAAPLEKLTDPELQGRADDLRETIARGRSLSSAEILVPGFALVNEAARRTLGITFYDVQLLAGLALARGMVAQMQTGEGKTFVAALPAFIHALTGRGVHVITANKYLAGRDFEWLAPVFQSLGVSAGLLGEQVPPHQKRAAYACEITYGTGYEFGFDYLRDQLALRRTEERRLGDVVRGLLRGGDSAGARTVQRGLAFAIIDEVDNVLIDDAGSPLILSDQAATAAEDAQAHLAARRLIARLRPAEDYTVDTARGTIDLTAAGAERVHGESAEIPFEVLLRPWIEYVEQALRADQLFRRDVHYVVDDEQVRIVDETTGRIFAERHWRDGLHQAIEAKEQVPITAEKQPLAQITRQRFYRLYDGLCGMTGTAIDSRSEFRQFYRLPVAVIPLRLPSKRQIQPTRYFAGADSKWSAVAEALAELHRAGRPVLVGTQSIADSERMAAQLDRKGLPYQLLNGRQDAEEAEIVARAGRRGAITIATNMAGRGTDIRLAPEVVQLGGLHVIATQRHESRRIDRQLVGRAARQGDPGSAQFFLSAEDPLIVRFGPWLGRNMQRGARGGGEIHVALDPYIRKLQRRTEQLGFARRRQLFRYDRYRDTVMAKIAGEDEPVAGH